MKIKTRKVSYEYVMAIQKPKHKRPRKPWLLLTTVVRLLSFTDLWATKFKYSKVRMDKAGKGPYLILMNHSSFIDLKIASKIFYPMPYCIVCTTDGFVGKSWLMRLLGCIPTQKYVTDISLIMDMLHAIKKNKTSVLMFPEAGYSFDGCATTLPRKLGVLIKKLDVPVLTVITDGAFLRDPLYNCLQKRKVKVTAELKCMLTKDEVREKSVKEIDALLDDTFSFDNFAKQYETKTKVTESFRADGLNRILYKCAHCHTEGMMEGKGTTLVCNSCGKEYELGVFGRLKAKNGLTEFPHIPDWYKWQRECVKRELEKKKYSVDVDVNIGILADYKALNMVGQGKLSHNENGFKLTGCDGKLSFEQSPLASFSLNSDYYWYEIGDVICIGNKDRLYYCFPKTKDIVTKVRLAAEELYKLCQA